MSDLRTLYSVLQKHCRISKNNNLVSRCSKGIDWLARIQSLPKTHRKYLVRWYLKEIQKVEVNGEKILFPKLPLQMLFKVKRCVNYLIIKEHYKDKPMAKSEVVYKSVNKTENNIEHIFIFQCEKYIDIKENSLVCARTSKDKSYWVKSVKRVRIYKDERVDVIDNDNAETNSSVQKYCFRLKDMSKCWNIYCFGFLQNPKIVEIIMRFLNLEFKYVSYKENNNVFQYLCAPYLFIDNICITESLWQYVKDINWRDSNALKIFCEKYNLSQKILLKNINQPFFNDIIYYYIEMQKLYNNHDKSMIIAKKMVKVGIPLNIAIDLHKLSCEKFEAFLKIDKQEIQDIINMLNRIPINDLSNIPVREWHDYMVSQLKILNERNERVIYKKKSIFKGIKEFKEGDFIFKIPRSSHVLREFGDKLHICVGYAGYFNYIKREWCYIIMCYKENKPYACFEIKRDIKLKLIQAKLACNKLVKTDEELSKVVKNLCEKYNVEIDTKDILT